MSQIIELLIRGAKVICSIAPDKEVAKSMSKLYKVKPIIIWIDTPQEIIKSRLKEDRLRMYRLENDFLKNNADIIFKPTNNLKKDSLSFIKLINDL